MDTTQATADLNAHPYVRDAYGHGYRDGYQGRSKWQSAAGRELRKPVPQSAADVSEAAQAQYLDGYEAGQRSYLNEVGEW